MFCEGDEDEDETYAYVVEDKLVGVGEELERVE